uniref:Uncharacterized protein n=1 Tax=Anopheles farauti TaxID=69004 RepID=A0A182QQ83_9DIPT
LAPFVDRSSVTNAGRSGSNAKVHAGVQALEGGALPLTSASVRSREAMLLAWKTSAENIARPSGHGPSYIDCAPNANEPPSCWLILVASVAVVISATLALEFESRKLLPGANEQDDSGLSMLEQTPAEDRQWQAVKKHEKRQTGKKIHIFLGKPKGKKSKKHAGAGDGEPETQTRKTPELTTRSDKGVIDTTSDAPDAAVGESQHYEIGEHNVVKEKIKIKHHHHHHHHNHVKTVVKKEPYPVEKVVQVPVEKIVHVPKPYPVEKIVEKIVHVPKPYPVYKQVQVPVPVEVKVPYEVPKPVPYPVEKKVPYPVEVKVPVEVEKKVPVPVKVEVEKKVPYPVKVYVPQPYPVEKKVPYPVPVKSGSFPFSFDKDITSYANTRLHPFESQHHEEFAGSEDNYRRTTKTGYKKGKGKKSKKTEQQQSQQPSSAPDGSQYGSHLLHGGTDHYGSGSNHQEVIVTPPSGSAAGMQHHATGFGQQQATYALTAPSNPGGSFQLESQPQPFQLLQLAPFQYQTPTGFSLPTAR